MLKKLKVYLFVILILQTGQSFAIPQSAPQTATQTTHAKITCTASLRPLLAKVQQLASARTLLAQIQSEGPLHIKTQNTSLSEQFGAFWDPEERAISICWHKTRSEGEMIGSMLFEMHNAAVSRQFENYDRLAANGKIGKAEYVRSVEHLEYQNSLKASRMATEGIEKGIFPASAHLPTYSNFEEHFYYQQIGGHSDYIAQNYDELVFSY
jgi:hypothetical protein